MTLRPPQALAPARNHDGPLNAALEHEILAEKAATYGRLLKRLEQSLAALRDFDSAHGDSSPVTPEACIQHDGPGLARVRPDGRAKMPVPGLAQGNTRGASRPRASSRAMRRASPGCPDNRPKGGKRERAPAGQAAHPEAGPKDRTAAREKERLLDTAGEALWYVMIQREVCGLCRHDLFCRQLGVPAAVRLRIGPVRA